MEQYEIISLIGQGAYGRVLKARNLQTKQIVAIKKFKQSDHDENIHKIIHRQIQILRSLRHPNIVKLKQVFKKRGIYHLVFQYLDNNILQILQSSKGGIQKKLIVKYIYQVLLGLSFMHKNNHIHRDIKPQNLLVNHQHILKLCDMGFAKNLNQSQKLTEYVATRWYRSPQLLLGLKYGTAADIWATGCLMAELIDGNPLFPGEDQIDQIKKIQDFFSVNLRSIKKQFSKSIYKNKQNFGVQNLNKKYLQKINFYGVDLLKKMLQIDPNKRITAQQTLNHAFFDDQRPRNKQTTATPIKQQNFRRTNLYHRGKYGSSSNFNQQQSSNTYYGTFEDLISKMKQKMKRNTNSNINTQRCYLKKQTLKSIPTDITLSSQKDLYLLKGINKIYDRKIQRLNEALIKKNQNSISYPLMRNPMSNQLKTLKKVFK